MAERLRKEALTDVQQYAWPKVRERWLAVYRAALADAMRVEAAYRASLSPEDQAAAKQALRVLVAWSKARPAAAGRYLDELATERGVARLDGMVARRLAGEPLQYVLGHWPFRSRSSSRSSTPASAPIAG